MTSTLSFETSLPAERGAPARYATERTPERLTYGPAIGKVATAMLGAGGALMPWQRQVADVGTELREDGTWAYRTVLVTVQRQSGKTTLLGPKNVHRGLIKPDAGLWLTAQTRQDARDTWLNMVKMIRRSPLAGKLKIRESNGSESVTFPAGGAFRPFAPTQEAMHGKTNESVDVDEGWAFDDEQGRALEAAIVPTFTTTGGQLWMVSTAGTAASTWLARFVDIGRAAALSGARGPFAYFEWSLPDEHVEEVSAGLDRNATPAERRHAFDLVLAAHPAAGHTLRVDALEQAASTMSVGEFLRAYGNVWTRTSDRLVPEHLWNARRESYPMPEPATMALAFDVAPGRADAAILAAWRETPAGPIRHAVVDSRPGASWLADRVVELVERWRPLHVAHDGAGPALDVADELRRRGVELRATKTREYASACSGFLADVVDAGMTHSGQPALDDAVASAAKREVGDGLWVWSRRLSSATIAPLVAATVAAWALRNAPEPAPAPAVVVRRRPRL